MYLENIVIDAIDPRALGRFWEAALGTETLTDEPEGFETRLAVPEGPVLDLCFQRVPEAPGAPQRLHLDISGADDQRSVVERLLALGASEADKGQGQTPWTLLADPEGNVFRVVQEGTTRSGTGPVTALTLDVADADRDQDFWCWLTGWAPVSGSGSHSLQHSSHRGPALSLRPEAAPKGSAKNRLHLDVRLEPDDDPDPVAREIADRGGHELHPDWGDLP